MALRAVKPGLMGPAQAFTALGTADSPAYFPQPLAKRIDIMALATEAGTAQLMYLDPNDLVISIGSAVAIGANELYPFQIDVLIINVFKPFIRYVNTSNASGTVRFYANDDDYANQP